MNAKQKYLLMKHSVRLERAYDEIVAGIKKDFILKWTKNPLIRVGGHYIPKGSIVITLYNIHILKEMFREIDKLLWENEHINDYNRLIKTALETTSLSWTQLLNNSNEFICPDRLKRRWDLKKLFKREGLEDLLSPKDLIKCV